MKLLKEITLDLKRAHYLLKKQKDFDIRQITQLRKVLKIICNI